MHFRCGGCFDPFYLTHHAYKHGMPHSAIMLYIHVGFILLLGIPFCFGEGSPSRFPATPLLE